MCRQAGPVLTTLALASAAGKGDGTRGADRAASPAKCRPHQAQPARHGARGGLQRQAMRTRTCGRRAAPDTMARHMNGRHRSLEADARQTPWESLDRDGTSENLFSGKRLLRETK
jgi:hypothetical protein